MVPLLVAVGRNQLRDRMIEHAHDDPEVVAAALLGSAARLDEDQWSDIDLALRLAPEADLGRVTRDWTAWVSGEVQISDHLDIEAWGARYRVLLCADGLQIDLSLWPHDTFRAINGEPMTILFGESLAPDEVPPRDWTELSRMSWLYALHARSAIKRGRVLQADRMLGNWRDRIVALAALRHDLNPDQAREAHLLPADVQAEIAAARPANLSPAELDRALTDTAGLYLTEVRAHDSDYGEKLGDAITALTQ